MILTSGTTGTPKGAQRGQPDTLGPLAALFSRIPLQADERTMIAAPLFHSWGFAHFLLGAVAQLDLRPAPPVRPRGDAEGDRRARRDGARRRAGDDAADPRAARGDARQVRPAEPAGDRGERLGAARASWRRSGWTPSATTSTTSTARPRSPGRRSRRPRTCARRPAPPAGRRAGPWCKIVDEDGKRGRRRARPAAIFVGNEMAFEGYTGGGGKDVDRRPAVLRRRRPLRRRRAACSSTAATTR